MTGKNGFSLHQKGDISYYSIPDFDHTGLVRHGFSTRRGGVSTGEYDSLNLGFKRLNSLDAVMQNFKMLAGALQISVEDMVCSDQVHGDRVLLVGGEDRGKGILRESDIQNADGLMTGERGVALVTFYADCVPLFFLDTVHKAIALTHSGWRGTAAHIGAKTLAAMNREFGTNPQECLIGIGPSIGPCCFEVDQPVVDAFKESFAEWSEFIQNGTRDKYYIDLWKANQIQLMEKGVPERNITVAAACTSCHSNEFFSYRREKGRTGSMAAVLMLT